MFENSKSSYNATLPAIAFGLFNDLRYSLRKGGGTSEVVEAYKQHYPQFAAEIEQCYLANLEIGMGSEEEMPQSIFADLYSEEINRELREVKYKYGHLAAIVELRVNLIACLDIENRLSGQVMGDVDSLMASLRLM
jgi:hypothetical protein